MSGLPSSSRTWSPLHYKTDLVSADKSWLSPTVDITGGLGGMQDELTPMSLLIGTASTRRPGPDC